MNKSDKTSEQTEQTTISSSLRFGLLAAALTTLGDAIAAIAALSDRILLPISKRKMISKNWLQAITFHLFLTTSTISSITYTKFRNTLN